MALADDYKTRAIAFGVTKAQEQRVRVQQIIGSLAAEAERRIDGEGGWGAAYLHLDLTSVNQETIDAVASAYGQEFLRSADLGFQVEAFGSGIIIRWAQQAEIEAAVDLILNPPPIVETPENPEIPNAEPPVSEPAKRQTTSGLLGKLRPKA
jgi:hypothetical protein